MSWFCFSFRMTRARRWRGLLALVWGSACVAALAADVPLRLVAFNDFHGMLRDQPRTAAQPQQRVGGGAFLAGWIGALKADHPGTLVFSSGDLVGASPLDSAFLRDEPTLEMANAIGLDAAVVGNHEFDQGVAELQRKIQGGCAKAKGAKQSCPFTDSPYHGSRFPWLAANVVDDAGRPVLAPYVVREVQGVRVGIVGVVTRDVPRLVTPSGIRGLHFLDEAQTLERYADALHARGVGTVIALVHEGGSIDGNWNDPQCPNARGRIFEIAPQVQGKIDVLFSAHTHQGYNCRVGAMPVMQAFSYGRGLSVVDLVIDGDSGKVKPDSVRSWNVDVSHVASSDNATAPMPLPAEAAPDPAVDALLARYASLTAQYSQHVVGHLAQALPARPASSEEGDSLAGRLVADAQWFATHGASAGGADFALMNPGGIRGGLACDPAPCDVTYGQLFQMQPFGNQLVVLTLSGRQVRALLEQQQSAEAAKPLFLQPSAQLRYDWDASAPSGQRAQNIRVDGRPLSPSHRYRVTVNSFLAQGGDRFIVLEQGEDKRMKNEDLEALVQYFAAAPRQLRDVPSTPRIRVRNTVKASE